MPKDSIKIGVLGAGAAGYFAAIQAKRINPNSKVDLIEKSGKTLSKVKISGGGRCNVTHHCIKIRELSRNYPRGERFLSKAFAQFNVADTIEWFQNQGVILKVEDDGRMFPVSNQSETIVNALQKAADAEGVNLILNQPVYFFESLTDGFVIHSNRVDDPIFYDRLIVAYGGQRNADTLQWAQRIHLPVIKPVPSLFTFNVVNDPIKELMGVSISNAVVKIIGEDLSCEGALLITHWGFSGPAILKTSAFGARILAEKNYSFDILINWVGKNEEALRHAIANDPRFMEGKQLKTLNPFELPKRLWMYILNKSGADGTKRWSDQSKKVKNRLLNTICNDQYTINGKTTFKEEFVTAGGVDLNAVNPNTMEAKEIPGLFFAGEVLDIDGITGGFNFQAAWTTGFIAGSNAAGSL